MKTSPAAAMRPRGRSAGPPTRHCREHRARSLKPPTALCAVGGFNDLALCSRQCRVGGPADLPRGRIAAAGEVFMSNDSWALLLVYCVLLVLLAVPLGRYIGHVMEGRLRFAGRVEAVLYRLCGV